MGGGGSGGGGGRFYGFCSCGMGGFLNPGGGFLVVEVVVMGSWKGETDRQWGEDKQIKGDKEVREIRLYYFIE